jgi:threonylcarbamoyladenosine tRNA methylthiotransferase MtaB
LHVFTYSERPNTTAIRIKEKVPMEVRNERSKRLHILGEKKKRHFYEQQINKEFNVLFESENDGGMMYGFTENYVKVQIPYDPLMINEIKNFKIVRINQFGFAEGYIKESIAV